MNTPYNFDEPIERRGTSSVKYDMAVRRGKDPDLLPLWVADMDFRISEEAICAIKARADHGIFGYTDPDVPYYKAVQSWYASHHGWHIEQSWFTITPGVVFALAAAVRAFTKPGDAVLIQPPVYYPFRHVVRDNNRTLATAPVLKYIMLSALPALVAFFVGRMHASVLALFFLQVLSFALTYLILLAVIKDSNFKWALDKVRQFWAERNMF